METVYERLDALQIQLPEIPPPVADGYVPLFVPFVRTGNLIYLSGRLAKKGGKPFSGKLGQEITMAEGRQAARGVAIELLATLHGALPNRTRSPMAPPNFFWKSLASAARMPAPRLARRRSHSVLVWRSR